MNYGNKVGQNILYPLRYGGVLQNGYITLIYAHLISCLQSGFVLLQQDRSCENEIHWITFSNCQLQSTDIYINLVILISLSGSIELMATGNTKYT